MNKGPKGQKRPADVNGNAVKVMKIATGEIEEELDEDGKDPAAKAMGKTGAIYGATLARRRSSYANLEKFNPGRWSILCPTPEFM